MILRLIAVSVTSAVCLAATTTWGQKNTSTTYDQLQLFGEVFEQIRAKHVEDVSEEKLIEAAINGMLSSLDPHSSYLSPKSFQDMQIQTQGQFGGLGIEVTMENGFVKVVSPIDDTPAFHAGLKPNDYITHLDGEPVLGLSLSEAVKKMRGSVGTDIVLTIRRADLEPFEVTITRAVIEIKSVRSRLEGEDIGYIRITTFNQRTSNELENELKKLVRETGDSLKGLVLDLRNNPGGLLNQSIRVTDYFLKQGEIVSTRARASDDSSRANAQETELDDLSVDLPLVVLVNGGSASASEIVAGALQDHRRAIIMGTRTFGKGSVQTIIPLGGDRGAIRLTTARYFTPSGRSIQARGIEPDIVVEQARLEKLDPRPRPREENLRRRLENPDGETDSNGDPAPEATPDRQSQPAPEDYQLARAIDLLRGIALFQGVSSN